MSTNISKQKREDLIHKINAIRTFIANSPQDKNTGNLLNYLSELEKDINGKKYGLIFEEHRENIDNLLDTHTPVLTEDKSLFIDNGGDMNFLIEGDNLAALQLLEKTHKGKIDVIYIDPPYNTKNKEFIYDDVRIGLDDSYRHSKWLSFIYKRVMIAKRLLKESGTIFISIDENEIHQLKIILDDIFSDQNFIGEFIWKARSGKSGTSSLISMEHEYILCYSKNKNRVNFYQEINVNQKEKLEALRQWGQNVYREDRPTMFFPIFYNNDTFVFPTKEEVKQIYLGNKTFDDQYLKNLIVKYESQGLNSILPIIENKYGRWRKGYDGLKKLAKEHSLVIDEDSTGNKILKKIVPMGKKSISALSSILESFGTSSSGTKEIKKIFDGVKAFDTTKPLDLICHLIYLATYNLSNATILDFFAGSGTTGHATLQLNNNSSFYKHKYILCTNNENNICRNVTYKRLASVINGYGDNAPIKSSLKYYKVDYIPINKKMYYEYADELLKHVRELVELENSINFTHNEKIAIILTDDELSEFISNIDVLKNCETIYLGHDVLPSEEQEEAIKTHNINVNIIPDYYYRNLQEM